MYRVALGLALDALWLEARGFGLLGLLLAPLEPEVAVPPWPRFLRGCVRYRGSLDRELPDARLHDRELES